MATQAINHRHYPIAASESREKGDAADEGINAAVDARMSYPWSHHVASANGLAPVETVNGRFINSHRIANNRTYDFTEVCDEVLQAWKKKIRELKEADRTKYRGPSLKFNLLIFYPRLARDHRIIAVSDMSSRVKQQIRITIFFNDGIVVIYIWIGDVVTQIKSKRDQRRRFAEGRGKTRENSKEQGRRERKGRRNLVGTAKEKKRKKGNQRRKGERLPLNRHLENVSRIT